MESTLSFSHLGPRWHVWNFDCRSLLQPLVQKSGLWTRYGAQKWLQNTKNNKSDPYRSLLSNDCSEFYNEHPPRATRRQKRDTSFITATSWPRDTVFITIALLLRLDASHFLTCDILTILECQRRTTGPSPKRTSVQTSRILENMLN